MTYQETIEYLYSRLPMFTKVGSSAIKPGLNNIIAFCSVLGNPEKKIKTIHVGGTNGKGSSSHMLAAIFQSAGYKTGLYTSPHLVDFRERIRVNGEMMPEDKVVSFVAQHKNLIEDLKPSFFETTVAMAFNYFANEQVDIAIIEVGLGGRLDSTNIIHPELSLITNISKDHTNILGNTIPEIAFEKAGIIKQKTPVIIGEYEEESAAVFIEKANSTESKLLFADKELRAEIIATDKHFLSLHIYDAKKLIFHKLELDLTGTYQQKNILGVIACVLELRNQGWELPDDKVRIALSNTKKLTGLAGRWHKLADKPLTYCDTGHNEAGIKEVLLNIQNTTFTQLHIVMGMVKDKDVSTVLNLLPKNAIYYFCAPAIERSLPFNELQQQAANFNLKGLAYNSVKAAYQAAKQNAHAEDLIFIGGSTFVVAEIL